jgi:Protein of unknown function (DUF4232)
MSMSSTEKRRARAVVLSATAVLGAGALGAAIAPTASAAAGPSQCRTADLSAQLKPGSPGAGQRYATVVLTNTSGHTCTVTGYGGLALLGAPGQGVPTDLRRAPAPAPVTVPLAPGRSARSLLHWTVIPGANEPGAVCERTAVTVVVTPPGRTTAALRPWTFGPVCQHGRIDQNAYVAGSGAF